MENKMIRQIRVPVSFCDNNANLSVLGIFSLFMDMASEHGEEINLGREGMAEKGLIWLISKTKIRIKKRPQMLEKVTVSTWPEAPGRIRCNRYYTIADASGIIVEGKNEWAMLETETGKLHKIADAYPHELEHCTDVVCEEPFLRLSDDFSGCEEFAKYTVRSTDIDSSRHMNNVEYLRAVFGAFSCKQLEDMNISEVEVSYRTQCYENEELSFKARSTDSGIQIGVIKADGKTAAVISLTFGK